MRFRLAENAHVMTSDDTPSMELYYMYNSLVKQRQDEETARKQRENKSRR